MLQTVSRTVSTYVYCTVCDSMKEGAALEKIELMHAVPEEKVNHHLCEIRHVLKIFY